MGGACWASWPFSVKESRCLFCKLKKFKTCKLMLVVAWKYIWNHWTKRGHTMTISAFFTLRSQNVFSNVFFVFLDSKTDLDIAMLIYRKNVGNNLKYQEFQISCGHTETKRNGARINHDPTFYPGFPGNPPAGLSQSHRQQNPNKLMGLKLTTKRFGNSSDFR